MEPHDDLQVGTTQTFKLINSSRFTNQKQTVCHAWGKKKVVENPSIDLGAYRMRSGRSTNELVPRMCLRIGHMFGHIIVWSRVQNKIGKIWAYSVCVTTKGARTLDHAIKSRALCRLSYSSTLHFQGWVSVSLIIDHQILKGKRNSSCQKKSVTIYVTHFERVRIRRLVGDLNPGLQIQSLLCWPLHQQASISRWLVFFVKPPPRS